LIAAAALMSTLQIAPAAAAGLVLEAEACRVDLTTGMDDFQINLLYQITVGQDGRPSRLDPVRKEDVAFAARRVHLDQFEKCVKRWRFASAGAYGVIFTLGTVDKTLERWTISVSRGGETFHLVMPRLPER
jgi:hypothetical protein